MAVLRLPLLGAPRCPRRYLLVATDSPVLLVLRVDGEACARAPEPALPAFMPDPRVPPRCPPHTPGARTDWSVLRRLHSTAPHDRVAASTVSVAWHPSSCYVYVSAPAEAAMYVMHVGSAQQVARIAGHHRINVRAIASDPHANRLASCSFDKTLRVYEAAAAAALDGE